MVSLSGEYTRPPRIRRVTHLTLAKLQARDVGDLHKWPKTSMLKGLHSADEHARHPDLLGR